MKVEFFPAAEEDMAEAASEYEARAPGLGDDFIREIERVTGMLINYPPLARISMKFTAVSRCGAFPTASYSVATEIPSE